MNFFFSTNVDPTTTKELFGLVKSDRYVTLEKHFNSLSCTDSVNDFKDDYGNTLLHIAVHLEKPKVMTTLLKLNASISCMNDINLTPIDYLMGSGNRKLFNSYIDFVKEQTNNKTNLAEVTALKNDNIVKKDYISNLEKKFADIFGNNKRLRDDNDELLVINKKLRGDLDKMTIANKALRDDVNSYIKLYKEK